MSKKDAVVVLSGGQDSTTCLFWAKQKFSGEIEAITLTMGRDIALNWKVRPAWRVLRVTHKILPINTFNTLGDALTGEIEVSSEPILNQDYPTFVPGRNLIFLTFAAAYAYQRKISNLVTGVAQTDYGGYPDTWEKRFKPLRKR